MAAASYGMTDTMGRMHSDAQFAGSSSVPAHVEMMGFLETDNTSTIRYTIVLLFLPTLNSKLLDTVFLCIFANKSSIKKNFSNNGKKTF